MIHRETLVELGEPQVTPALTVDAGLDLRFLDADVLVAASTFPVDTRRSRFDVRPSTVLDPAIVEAAQGAWIGYD